MLISYFKKWKHARHDWKSIYLSNFVRPQEFRRFTLLQAYWKGWHNFTFERRSTATKLALIQKWQSQCHRHPAVKVGNRFPNLISKLPPRFEVVIADPEIESALTMGYPYVADVPSSCEPEVSTKSSMFQDSGVPELYHSRLKPRAMITFPDEILSCVSFQTIK
jgi:hypothetical protein